MENTNKVDMHEIVGVYEQGNTRGADRGFQTGVWVTLGLVGFILAVLFWTGKIVVAERTADNGTTLALPLGTHGPVSPSGVVPPLSPILPRLPTPDTQEVSPKLPSGLRPAPPPVE